MKSISKLFLMLAIVVLVGSAFTSEIVKKEVKSVSQIKVATSLVDNMGIQSIGVYQVNEFSFSELMVKKIAYSQASADCPHSGMIKVLRPDGVYCCFEPVYVYWNCWGPY